MLNKFLKFQFANIGFIGLGNMGFGMALNLAKNNYLFAYDVDSSKQISRKNITFCKTLDQLFSKANIFILMLPHSAISKEVCLGPKGLFQNAKKNSLIIQSSTISPLDAMKLAQISNQHQHIYVDAPVSGGINAANAGTLTFMVGAKNSDIFEKVASYLKPMGKNIINCQKQGGGQIAKICNNMALAIEMIGVSQALSMGKKLGIDVKILWKIMSTASARCWSLDTYSPVPGMLQNVPSNRDYEKGFSCELMLKDLKIAIQCSEKMKNNSQLGIESKKIFEELVNKGYQKKDIGIIYQLLSKNDRQKK